MIPHGVLVIIGRLILPSIHLRAAISVGCSAWYFLLESVASGLQYILLCSSLCFSRNWIILLFFIVLVSVNDYEYQSILLKKKSVNTISNIKKTAITWSSEC